MGVDRTGLRWWGGQTRVIYCGETMRMKSRVRDTGGVKEQGEEEDRQRGFRPYTWTESSCS